jgi:hypothetical protein
MDLPDDLGSYVLCVCGVYYIIWYKMYNTYNEHGIESVVPVAEWCARGNGDRRRQKEKKKETEKTFPQPFVDNVLYYIYIYVRT